MSEPSSDSTPRGGKAKAIFGIGFALLLFAVVCGFCVEDALDLAGVTGPELPEVEASVDGASAAPLSGDLSELEVVWANAAPEASSQRYDAYSEEYSRDRAVGAPDVWPQTGDNAKAWEPRQINIRQTMSGEQWLVVSFPPTEAREILIVESHQPGALVRVDDLSGTPTAIWEGQSPAEGVDGRVLRVELPEARRLTKVRLNFDVWQVEDRPQIDAVGLVADEAGGGR